MNELTGIWSLSPLAALVGFIALLGTFLARGLLVTRRELEARIAAIEKGHTDEVSALKSGHSSVEAQLSERISDYRGREAVLTKRGDDWQAAYQTEVQTSSEWSAQARALTEVGRTTQHVLESIPTRPQLGGHDEQVERT